MQPSSRVIRNLGTTTTTTTSRPSKLTMADSNSDLKRSATNKIVRVSPSPPPLRTKQALSSTDSTTTNKKHAQQGISSRLYPEPSKFQRKLKQDKKTSAMSNSSPLYRPQVLCSNKPESPSDDLPPPKQDTIVASSSMPPSRHHIHQKHTKTTTKEEKAAAMAESARKQQGSSSATKPSLGGKKKVSAQSTKHGEDMATKGRIVFSENTDIASTRTPSNIEDDGGSPRRRSTDSSASAVTSSYSNGILSYGRLFSSRKSAEMGDCSKKKGDSSLMKSFLRKKGGSTETSTTAKRDPGKKLVPKSSHKVNKNDVSVSSSSFSSSDKDPVLCIIENSMDDTKNSSSDNNQDSCITFSIDLNEDSTFDPEPQTTVETSNFVSPLQHSLQSSCLSSSGDCVDTASSSSELGHLHRKAVSYSGKTTAAILQELLLALNSSKAPITLEDQQPNLSDISDCVSSSDSMLRTPLSELCSQNHRLCDPSFEDDSVSSDEIPKPMKRLSSPISTLEPPFEDDSTSESFCGTEECVSEKFLSSNQPDFVSRRHGKNISCLGKTSLNVAKLSGASECEEQYVKEIIGNANMSPVNVYAAMLQLPCPILDPAVFKNLEDRYHRQWEWGIKQEDTDSSNQFHDEAGVQNRKLIFDCVNEALNLNLGIDMQESQQVFPQTPILSPAYHLKSVSRQINVWREMDCSMNVDDLVEKEMAEGIGKWIDFSYEVSYLTLEMETGIMRGLIDEVVQDLTRRPRNRMAGKNK